VTSPSARPSITAAGANQYFGARRLNSAEADRFVAEQSSVGDLLGAAPLPQTARELAGWLECHPATGPSPGLIETVKFLHRPPLPFPVDVAYGVLFAAAAATVPPRLREIIGVRKVPGAIALGQSAVRALRWNLGSSPSWHLALVRTGAPIPQDMFRRTLA
jgi:hypothetical protein